jgi:alpha-beta hydrolase superfamily lysophospholipase
VSARRFTVTVGSHEVVGVLHLPAMIPSPCVVACHGMGASKDSDKYLLLGRELPAHGLALARFDFRGSGESGGLSRDATVTTRLADTEAVLDFLARQPELDGRLALLGSSLGGFVALWAAAGRPGVPLVTWNAPAVLTELAAGDPSDAAAPGTALVGEIHEGRYAYAPVGVPRALIVQGDRDEVVPPAHASSLFARCAEPKELCMIGGADHRLSDPVHRFEALERSRRWFLQHLPPRA